MLDKLDKALNTINKPNKPLKRKKIDNWVLSGWKKDEVQFNKNHIIDEIEKLEHSIYNDLINNKNTNPRPDYFECVDNVLTLIGMTESAKRDTDEVSTSVTHNSLGTSASAALESQEDLVSEVSGGTPTYARKSFAADGQRKVINQTAKYGMLWDDTDLDVTPAVDIKESGLHWHVSNASSMHARVTFTTYTFDAGDLFVIQMNELQANA